MPTEEQAEPEPVEEPDRLTLREAERRQDRLFAMVRLVVESSLLVMDLMHAFGVV
ncbi:hypothetical protein ACGFX4_38555 [Kitasatospora sp. NPDC048365]|uniref:hypothetical protein n=1 Tax=Kitasatospora sp. NPDC048365 TaxID=3364050 RepID=UPI0037129DD5